MRFGRRDFLRIAVSLTAAAGVQGAVNLRRLGRRVHERFYPAGAFQKEVPYFDSGFLVSRLSIPQPKGGLTNLALYSKSGELLYDLNLMPPGASQTSLRGVDVKHDGTAIVCGASVDDSGRIARFLMSLDHAGKPIHIIRTNPFQASHVCSGPNDSIWALGREILPNGVAPGDREVVYHYGGDGKLLGKHITSELPQYTARAADSSNFLRSSGDRIGMYIKGYREWIEFDRDGRLRLRAEVPYPIGAKDPANPFGIAMTESGAVFACFRTEQVIGLYELERASMSWTPIANTVSPHEASAIQGVCGAERDLLVLRTTVPNRLIWHELDSGQDQIDLLEGAVTR